MVQPKKKPSLMKPCDNYMVATWQNVDMACLVFMHHTCRCVVPKLQTFLVCIFIISQILNQLNKNTWI
jgi:hypothetical protein